MKLFFDKKLAVFLMVLVGEMTTISLPSLVAMVNILKTMDLHYRRHHLQRQHRILSTGPYSLATHARKRTKTPDNFLVTAMVKHQID
jgi:hypothetical protein